MRARALLPDAECARLRPVEDVEAAAQAGAGLHHGRTREGDGGGRVRGVGVHAALVVRECGGGGVLHLQREAPGFCAMGSRGRDQLYKPTVTV